MVHSNGKRSVGRWGPTPNPSGGGEFGDMGGWGVWEKLKNIYPYHYHAGLPYLLLLQIVSRDIKAKNVSGAIILPTP